MGEGPSQNLPRTLPSRFPPPPSLRALSRLSEVPKGLVGAGNGGEVRVPNPLCKTTSPPIAEGTQGVNTARGIGAYRGGGGESWLFCSSICNMNGDPFAPLLVARALLNPHSHGRRWWFSRSSATSWARRKLAFTSILANFPPGGKV